MLMLKLRPGSSGVARFPLLLSLALASLALGACAPGVDTAAAGSTAAHSRSPEHPPQAWPRVRATPSCRAPRIQADEARFLDQQQALVGDLQCEYR